MIRKTATGFQVDISNGRTKRHRKSFKTRAEAQRYERHFLNELDDGKPWTGSKKDNRKLSELIELWYKLHGQNLKNGKRREMLLQHTARALKNPIAKDFAAKDFSHYRSERLKLVKPKTINNEQTYLTSVFNELRRLKEINYENPLLEIRAIKIPERELSYLTQEEIDRLFKELQKHQETYQCALICLTCGTRWNEARTLQPNQLKNGQINLSNTKSGKNRYIPINDKLRDILNLPLTGASVKIFARCFELAKIKKTQGQNTHILRHTFASHFIMNGGDILTLKSILGHSDLKMTMRYAHLAPKHLQEALKFAPVVNMLS